MWMTSSLTLWVLWVCSLSRGDGFERDSLRGKDGVEAQQGGATQRDLWKPANVDELLELLHPQYPLVQRCLRGQGQGPSSQLPPDKVNWESTQEAALHRDNGAIYVIMAEIERTACRPREVCLEVSREYPESPRHVYVPRCVSVHRCGGCCKHEALHCHNTSHQLVNKTLVELAPSHMERSVIMVTFINHTSCECRLKQPLHAVIRREADAHRPECSAPGVLCGPGLVWDSVKCVCVQRNPITFSQQETDLLGDPVLALCGPNKVLDPDHCGCVCRNGLTVVGCGPSHRLDDGTCTCICRGHPPRGNCPPGQRWDLGGCACACLPNCPRGHAPQPGTCGCRCQESPRTCMQRGKRFNTHTCSCYRLPCRTLHRKCPSGFHFSHFVCSCIPEHMRTDEMN